MLVFIPYSDDHHGGTELLYSIRSLEKHFKSMSGLIVIGDLPKWYKGEHCLVRDVPSRKEYSMYLKVMTVAKCVGVMEFLYSNDDIFALNDFEKTLPNYYYQTCGQMAKKLGGRYKMQYNNCPPDWLNFDIHVPIVMRPFKWGSNDKMTDRPIKTNYANQAGLKGTELIDCKFLNTHSYDQIKSIIDEKLFFSTSPFCMNKDMMDVLKELYPKKSIYEK